MNIFFVYIFTLCMLFFVFQFILRKVIKVAWIDNYKVLELTIAAVGLFVLMFGAKTAYDQYWNDKKINAQIEEKQRKIDNYKNVITYYLDNNLNVFLERFESYVAGVFADLNRIFYEPGSDFVKNNSKIYDDFFNQYATQLGLPSSLLEFGHPIYKACNGVALEFDTTLRDVVESGFSASLVKDINEELKLKAVFIIFNLREIAQIIREDFNDYAVPNLNVVRNKVEYKAVENRFIEFLRLENNLKNAKKENRDHVALELEIFLKDYKGTVDPSSLVYNNFSNKK